MAILEIKKYPDPILNKKAQEIKEITPEIRRLAENMMETMLQGQGVGLAGPQVGQSKRIIAIKIEDEPRIYINPQILKRTRSKITLEEGCLSCPGFWLEIKRAEGIEMQAIDKDGKKIEIKTEGLLARILQHEIDHLDGVLIIDKINLLQKIKRTLTTS